jgi:hypothetical protein
VSLSPDGGQQIIAQKRSANFAGAPSEAARYLEGTLPNGLAFAANGDILVSNFGTDRLEIMTREGDTRVLEDSIDGLPIGKVNFVLRFDAKEEFLYVVETAGGCITRLRIGPAASHSTVTGISGYAGLLGQAVPPGLGIAPWMASATFGGPDLRTVYIGSLKGKRIPYFRSPIAGLPMVRWKGSLGALPKTKPVSD